MQTEGQRMARITDHWPQIKDLWRDVMLHHERFPYTPEKFAQRLKGRYEPAPPFWHPVLDTVCTHLINLEEIFHRPGSVPPSFRDYSALMDYQRFLEDRRDFFESRYEETLLALQEG